jgi:hypothetical protein
MGAWGLAGPWARYAPQASVWREGGGLHLHSVESSADGDRRPEERCHTSSLHIHPLLSFERLITTTFIQHLDKLHVIVLCCQKLIAIRDIDACL